MDVGDGDETYQPSRLDLRVDAVAYINHLSGLNRPRKATLLLRFPPYSGHADRLSLYRLRRRSVESSSSVPKPTSRSTAMQSVKGSVYLV